MLTNPLNPQNLSPEQISAAFGMCERPVKRLLRDYFVQFDSSCIRKGKGPKIYVGEPIKDEPTEDLMNQSDKDPKDRINPLEIKRDTRPTVDLPREKIPIEYTDIAGMLKMIHGDAKKNQIDTDMFMPDSLLKIPSGTGHLTVPQKKNDDGTMTMWSLDLHLRNPDAKFDKESIRQFCLDTENVSAAQKGISELIVGFLPSSYFIFNLLRSKNSVMDTLYLATDDHRIFIKDTRFDIVPNKILMVKLAPKASESKSKK